MSALLLVVITIALGAANVYGECQRHFRISEVEYNNPSEKNQDQFVEIYNGGIGVEKINNLHLVMYRSSDWTKIYHKDMNSRYTNSDGYYVQWLDEKLGLDSTLIALVCNNDFPSDLNVEGIIESEMDIIDVFIYEWNGNSLSQVVGNPLNIGLQFYVHQYPNNTATSISRCSCSTSANTSCFISNTWPSPGSQNNCSLISSSNEVTSTYSTSAVSSSSLIPTSTYEANSTYSLHPVSASPLVSTSSNKPNTTHSSNTVLASSLVPTSPSETASPSLDGTSSELGSLLPTTPVILTILSTTSTSNPSTSTDTQQTHTVSRQTSSSVSTTADGKTTTDIASPPSTSTSDSSLLVNKISHSTEMLVSTGSKGTVQITTSRRPTITNLISSNGPGLSSTDLYTIKSSTLPNEGYSSSSTEATETSSDVTSNVDRKTPFISITSTAPSAMTTEHQLIEATASSFSSTNQPSYMFSSPSETFYSSPPTSTLIAKITTTVGRSSSIKTTTEIYLVESDTMESAVTLDEDTNRNPSSANSSVATHEFSEDDSRTTILTATPGEEISVGTSTANNAVDAGSTQQPTTAYKTSATTVFTGLNSSSTMQPTKWTQTAPSSLDEGMLSSVLSASSETPTMQLSGTTSRIGVTVSENSDGTHAHPRTETTPTARLPHFSSAVTSVSTDVVSQHLTSLPDTIQYSTVLTTTNSALSCTDSESRMIFRNSLSSESITDFIWIEAPAYKPAHCGMLCFEASGCGQYLIDEEGGCFLQLNSN